MPSLAHCLTRTELSKLKKEEGRYTSHLILLCSPCFSGDIISTRESINFKYSYFFYSFQYFLWYNWHVFSKLYTVNCTVYTVYSVHFTLQIRCPIYNVLDLSVRINRHSNIQTRAKLRICIAMVLYSWIFSNIFYLLKLTLLSCLFELTNCGLYLFLYLTNRFCD